MGINATTCEVFCKSILYQTAHRFGEQNCLEVTKMSFKRLLRSKLSKSFFCSNILTPRCRARRVVDLKVPNSWTETTRSLFVHDHRMFVMLFGILYSSFGLVQLGVFEKLTFAFFFPSCTQNLIITYILSYSKSGWLYSWLTSAVFLFFILNFKLLIFRQTIVILVSILMAWTLCLQETCKARHVVYYAL